MKQNSNDDDRATERADATTKEDDSLTINMEQTIKLIIDSFAKDKKLQKTHAKDIQAVQEHWKNFSATFERLAKASSSDEAETGAEKKKKSTRKRSQG